MDHREPRRHPVARVNTTGNYVRQSVRALIGQGLAVDRSWLDPSDPRDATVVLGDARALVWDEVTGWRLGLFRSGRQGVRTLLDGAVHLGGGPLPAPAEVAHRASARTVAPGVEYRSYADADGFDDALRRY